MFCIWQLQLSSMWTHIWYVLHKEMATTAEKSRKGTGIIDSLMFSTDISQKEKFIYIVISLSCSVLIATRNAR